MVIKMSKLKKQKISYYVKDPNVLNLLKSYSALFEYVYNDTRMFDTVGDPHLNELVKNVINDREEFVEKVNESEK